MRRRFRQQPDGSLIEIPLDAPVRRPVAPAIFGDLPEYESPATGEIVRGRKQRREDMRRSGCRPYEGFESERRAADAVIAQEQKEQDRLWERRVEQTYYELRDGMTPREDPDKPFE